MVARLRNTVRHALRAKQQKKLSYAVRPLLRPIDIAKSPFDVVAFDFMVPFKPKSRQRNAYIMVIT